VQTSALESVLDYLRKQVGKEAMKDLSDTELLERFCGRREEAAFALLLLRHGPAVLGVCRRMLGDVHAAEDAFQATFLVLVRKAGSVRKRQSLGSFLYGVAYRTAARARVQAAERRTRERAAVTSSSHPDALDVLSRAEACAVLHEEMAHLPDKYRRPLVLCYLEGKTHEQAAREMAWPKSSVSGRLKRGCELLRQRLSLRGVTLSAGVLTVLLADQSARAVPALLTLSTVRLAAQALAGKATTATAAIGLAGGVLKAVIATRTGVLLSLLLTVGLAAAGVGVLASQPEKPKAAPPPVARHAEQPKAEPVAAVQNDLYGDPLPDGALARLGTVRLHHAGLWQVVFSADGKSLLSTGGDDVVRRWEISSGKLVGAQPYTLPPEDSGASAFLSTDAKTLACVGQKDLYFLDAVTGKELHRVPLEKSYEGVAFTADGKRFAATTFSGEILLFDVATGTPVKTGLPAKLRSNSVALDPNGKLLAAPGENYFTVALWGLPDGKARHVVRVRVSNPALVFSHDGSKLLIRSVNEAFILNTATGAKEGVFPFPPGFVCYGFCLSEDGAQFAACCLDSIMLVDTKTMNVIRTITNTNCRHLQFSPDSKTLAGFGGSAIRLWNVADGKPLHNFNGHNDARAVVYSPDGTRLATGGDGMICVWAVATRKLRTTIRIVRFGRAFIFSSDGQTLFGSAGFGVVKAWNVADGKEMATFHSADDEKERGNNISSLQLSPDGKRLTASSQIEDENFLITWDILSGKRLDRTTWPRASESITFAPRGEWLAYSKQGSFVLHDLATKQERVIGGFPQFAPYTFSPDGALLAIPASDTSSTADLPKAFVKIVETATGKVRITLPAGTGAVNAFTPDNRFLFTTSLTEFRLWELATGKEVLRRPVEGMPYGWNSATFANQAAVAPDGRSAATSLPTGSILIWDLLPSSRLKGTLTVKDLESLWADLGGEDAAKAYYAGGRLLSAPDMASVFLSKQLRPTADDETKRIRSLIETLNDDDFLKRKAAHQELKQLGLLAEPELRRALDGKPSAETRHSVQDLLDSMETLGTVRTAEERRQTRALWVLEQIGSAEARKTLERLAGGAAAARQTREAKSALQRLKAKE
jgi:RNA polymerase sigma factor (sigma-70 family)